MSYVFHGDRLCFFLYLAATSGPTEQHQKLIKEDDVASVERQDVTVQGEVSEADKAPSSSETPEEQQARCSTTERQNTGPQNTGVRVGRTHKLNQCAKLKEEEEECETKNLMEYQDDLADADYTPSQSVFSVLCLFAAYMPTVFVMLCYYYYVTFRNIKKCCD